jgi:hypothetical protein
VRVGYFAQGEGPHLETAQYLIASCRRVMPDVEIHQLTDGETPVPEGVIAQRIPGKVPMGVRRIKHYSQPEGDWLFLDTDVLVMQDVRSVFDEPFDVALASRDGTYMAGTEYARAMPYNFGVVFSRGPEFWKFMLPHLMKMPPEMQQWEGEQLLTCELAKLDLFKTKILPSSYNFTPANRGDDVGHVHLLHLKGPRKKWLKDYTETQCTM